MFAHIRYVNRSRTSTMVRSFAGLVAPSRSKVATLEDAVSTVHSGDTVTSSGFVAQGCPEAVLEALGQRFVQTGAPHSLTLFFGAGPGDFKDRGLNHLAKRAADGPEGTEHNMIWRTIASHYGQVPMIEKMVMNNEIQGYNLPLGSFCRMVRAQASHLPGHLTRIGIGTFVDPDMTGGKINQLTRDKGMDIVVPVMIEDTRYLLYKALPINIGIIRATTADPDGNLTFEHEALLVEQQNVAMAAKNSGGIVIAQVKRLAASGSLPARDVRVPGSLVDIVVIVDEADHATKHGTSFFHSYTPTWTGELREPTDYVEPIPMDVRKIIGRRGAMQLKPYQMVNLGVGIPEGVAAVAQEENLLDYLTITTEAGAYGGTAKSGHDFGPAANPHSLVEMNQQFDVYNGGGLDRCFLGMAQVNAKGDVNVSKLTSSHITGPGGFIDITQATRHVFFMGSFTAKGLDVELVDPESDHKASIKIVKDGEVKKFVSELLEVTFSGDEAAKRGQTVLYITERCVFRRTPKYPVLELIEIAPGVDLQRDILDQMEFEPIVAQNLKTMDSRIFRNRPMDLAEDILVRPMRDRCLYHSDDHTLFVDLAGLTVASPADVRRELGEYEKILKEVCEDKGEVHIIVNYDGFDCRVEVEPLWVETTQRLQDQFYAGVRRFSGRGFHHMRLGKNLALKEVDFVGRFKEFDIDNNGAVSPQEIREGMRKNFGLKISPEDLDRFMDGKSVLTQEDFANSLRNLFKYLGRQVPEKPKH